MANFIPKIEYIELNTLTPKSITFNSPPEDEPLNEEYSTSSTVTTSNNGQRQYQFNHIRKSYELEFLYQPQSVKDALLDFFLNHAVKGGKFNYFIHSDEVTSEEMEIDGKVIGLDRPIPDGAGDFEYNFKLKISRVVG